MHCFVCSADCCQLLCDTCAHLKPYKLAWHPEVFRLSCVECQGSTLAWSSTTNTIHCINHPPHSVICNMCKAPKPYGQTVCSTCRCVSPKCCLQGVLCDDGSYRCLYHKSKQCCACAKYVTAAELTTSPMSTGPVCGSCVRCPAHDRAGFGADGDVVTHHCSMCALERTKYGLPVMDMWRSGSAKLSNRTPKGKELFARWTEFCKGTPSKLKAIDFAKIVAQG